MNLIFSPYRQDYISAACTHHIQKYLTDLRILIFSQFSHLPGSLLLSLVNVLLPFTRWPSVALSHSFMSSGPKILLKPIHLWLDTGPKVKPGSTKGTHISMGKSALTHLNLEHCPHYKYYNCKPTHTHRGTDTHTYRHTYTLTHNDTNTHMQRHTRADTHTHLEDHVLRPFTEEITHEMTLVCPSTHGSAACRDALCGNADLGESKLSCSVKDKERPAGFVCMCFF